MNNEDAVTDSQTCNLVLTKDCQYAVLTPITASLTDSYTVNDESYANNFDMSDFTSDDPYCTWTYSLKFWDSSLSGDNV